MKAVKERSMATLNSDLHFLFGAGASRYSGPPNWAGPPLGKDLFQALTDNCPTWRSLSSDVQQEFCSPLNGFEHGMESIRWSHDLILPRLIREMAIFFLSFELPDNSLYTRLLEWLRRQNFGKFSISTLNYDTLIEQSLDKIGINYFPFKIHGCPTFVPRIPDGINIIADHCMEYVSSPVDVYYPYKARDYWPEISSDDSIRAPAMAQYAPKKNVLHCSDYVDKIQSRWKLVIKDVSKIFIVGATYTKSDTHIWDPLSETNASLYFVNPAQADIESFAAWARTSREYPTFHIKHTFEEFIAKLESRRIRKLGWTRI